MEEENALDFMGQHDAAKGPKGFKDMRLFNQALLAHQASRLLQQPDTLCAQVLKAKYFPHGLLTDTVFSGNASSTFVFIFFCGNGNGYRNSGNKYENRY
jgi:hypothetical protein